MTALSAQELLHTVRNITLSKAARVRVEGSLVFVTDMFPAFVLEILDATDPTALPVVASYELTAAPRDLDVAGSLVFLAMPPARNAAAVTPTEGVLILRVK